MTTRHRSSGARRDTDARAQAASLIVRHDPAIAPLDCADGFATDDPVRLAQVHEIAYAAPDADTALAALGIEQAFLDWAGVGSLATAPTESIDAFIAAGSTRQAQLLRYTSLATCTIALARIGLDDPARPRTMGSLPAVFCGSEKRTHSRRDPDRRTPAQQRASTNDEVMLVRMAVLLVPEEFRTSSAAAIAVAGCGATQPEVPAVLARHRHPQRSGLHLPGRHLQDPSNAHHIAPRWVDLDGWSGDHVNAAASEFALAPADSLAYRGSQHAGSQAARTWCGKAVNRAAAAAGLDRVWGMSIGSLALWRLAHTVHHFGPDVAAREYGDQASRTIHKLVTQMTAVNAS